MGSKRARARRPPRRRLRRPRPRRVRARAEPDAYGYPELAGDLLAVLDDRGIDRAVLAGASMGAHTLVRFALDHGDRVAGLVVVTPAFDPDDTQDEERRLARWDALSDGLREGGVEGFVEAYGEPKVARALARDGLQGAAPAPGAPTSTPTRWPTRCARCRARGRSRTGPSWPSSRCRRRRRQPRRGRPRAPVRGRRALRGGDPRRASCVSEEPGQLAARLAGQPALEGHRGGRRDGLTADLSLEAHAT